ncbi:MAG: sugar phosphate isomerase/epimerase, partial [Cyclobacteriaceae bacterium]|nr:sugar phosphate isomerase/epimerase [Cyclobacteriaceae bacterium HetDA_MAG_MS6]
MDIKYCCPKWGSEKMSFYDFFQNVKSDGYDGVEMVIPTENHVKAEIQKLLTEFDLLLIAQQGESGTEYEFRAHKEKFVRYLRNAIDLRPIAINTQTGKDFFTFEENLELIQLADKIGKESGVAIWHELHRGKFSYSPTLTQRYMTAYPALTLTADLSHWMTVSESRLQSPQQQEAVNEVISRSHHIHARIGFEEGPQVNDPTAPEWAELLEIYLGWWQGIVDNRKSAGAEVLTITPEFGPAPYMPVLPYSQMPVSDQWKLNTSMMRILKSRLTAK